MQIRGNIFSLSAPMLFLRSGNGGPVKKILVAGLDAWEN
jgi:hypothetical protein